MIGKLKNTFILFFTVLSLVSCGDDRGGWQVSTPMIKSRFASSVIVNDNNIYAIGGADSRGYIWDAEWSTFDDSGNIKEWKRAPSLNEPRGYVPGVYHNGFLYVVGGANGEHGANLLDTVERAKINPDGSIGRWVVEDSVMTTARRGGQATVIDGYLYAIGGYNGMFLHSVERAEIKEDGSLDKWAELTPMMFERYIHSSLAVGDVLYSMGGHKNASGGALKEVEYGKISKDSLEVQWHSAPSLNEARYDAGVVFADGAIYIAGGYDDNAIDTVEKSRVGADGVLSKWNVVSKLPSPVYGAALVNQKGKLYLVGGAYGGSGNKEVSPLVYAVDIEKLGRGVE